MKPEIAVSESSNIQEKKEQAIETNSKMIEFIEELHSNKK